MPEPDRDPETTAASFPTYAELAQTSGWDAAATTAIRGDGAGDPDAAPGALGRADELVQRDTRYAEGALLGVGGMGKVVLARDARIGRDVAVKLVHSGRQLAPDQRARFLREARVQGQLEHPSIVPVYDLDVQADGALFFTMRRVIGRTLHAILDEHRAGDLSRHSLRELLNAFATVCLTVDYAHSRGVIHRDLKPANLMLGHFGEVYVLDWGLARLVDEVEPNATPVPASRLSAPGVLMGTPLYMAPEQVGDPAVGPSADVFALGAILFEILTLLPARDAEAAFGDVDARCSVRAPARGVAPELEAICVRATAREPAARFTSARDLHAAVTSYLDGDRELEQRRALAAAHARAAVEHLALADGADATAADQERARGEAMRELVRAMSLDPENPTQVAALATLLQTPPRITPTEVAETIAASEQEAVRRGARFGLTAMVMRLVFIGIVVLLGARALGPIVLLVGPIIAAAGLSLWVLLRPPASRGSVLGVCVLMLVGIAATGVYAGPLVLVPTMASCYALAIQVHPRRATRLAVVATACAVLVIPVVLQAVGVLPPSYLWQDGRMIIVPHLLPLGPVSTTLILLAGSTLALLSPAFFVGSARDALSDAERRLLLQAWHFRRLGER